MQINNVLHETEIFQITLPDPNSSVMEGVKWGNAEAFLTPAYWAFQILSRRQTNHSLNYKLGNTLKEEVGACLLGGHGIPAHIGVAAFDHIKSLGAFEDSPPDEHTLLKWLKEPININGRQVRYRFANQKAKYLARSLHQLANETPPTETGKDLRNWLIKLPGIGFKTASWIARNWLDADDVAILDIHIFRAGVLGGFFDPKLTVEKHYLELEEQFLKLSHNMGVRASELDALIWHEMMLSPRTVRKAMKSSGLFSTPTDLDPSARRANQRKTNTRQISLPV